MIDLNDYNISPEMQQLIDELNSITGEDEQSQIEILQRLSALTEDNFNLIVDSIEGMTTIDKQHQQ